MWIQLNNCFFSIIEDDKNEMNVWVRARRKGDLEKFFNEIDKLAYQNYFLGEKEWPEIIHTPKRDYLYRISLPKNMVAVILSRKVMEIDYHNFKASVADEELEEAYYNVWGALQGADDRTRVRSRFV